MTFPQTLALIVAVLVVYGIGPGGRRIYRRNLREAARRAWGGRNGSTEQHSRERGDKP